MLGHLDGKFVTFLIMNKTTDHKEYIARKSK